MTKCSECANALMRAEAAEALLEELRAECEELAAENEALRAKSDEKGGVYDVKVEPASEDYQQRMVEAMRAIFEEIPPHYEEQWGGSQWAPEEMRRMEKLQRLRPHGKAGKEKDWDRKTPPTTQRRTGSSVGGGALTVEISRDPYNNGLLISVRAMGRSGNVLVDERRLRDRGSWYLEELARTVLIHLAPDPPEGAVRELAQHLYSEFVRMGLLR